MKDLKQLEVKSPMTASECVASIIREMDAVKKTKGQNVSYNFRNIDEVMDAINPYLGKYGLSMNTEIVSFHSGSFQSVKKGFNGAPDTQVRKTEGTVHIRITLKKEELHNGNLVSTSVKMEAVAHSDDSGDKALTQAQSNAVKYALIFGFCMKSTDIDPDDKNPDDTAEGADKKPKTAKTPSTPPPTPQVTAPTPPSWVPETFATFKEKVVNMPIERNKKDSTKWALKISNPAKNGGIFCNATDNEAKEYVKLHSETLKEQGIAIPTELQ